MLLRIVIQNSWLKPPRFSSAGGGRASVRDAARLSGLVALRTALRGSPVLLRLAAIGGIAAGGPGGAGGAAAPAGTGAPGGGVAVGGFVGAGCGGGAGDGGTAGGPAC